MLRKLSDFFNNETAERAGCLSPPAADPSICGLEYDSRRIEPGFLYFALPGLHADGHDFIGDAVGRGAAAVVYEKEGIEKKPGVAYIRVSDSRFSMSPVAAAFYNYPSEDLTVIGVTGTEGKSTTVYLIWQLLRLVGKKAGFFSTVQHSLGAEEIWNTEHQTTPEAPAVQRLLHGMLQNGCEYAVIEASSHGLSKRTNRLGDVGFDAAVLTNVAHEHLEFHGTWEQYRDDKANLFRALDQRPAQNDFVPFGVVNSDDPSAAYFGSVCKSKLITFSTRGLAADLALHSFESSAGGNWYAVTTLNENEEFDVRDRLPGAFNAGNVLAALLTVGGLLGRPVRELAPLAAEFKPVRGRMTAVKAGQSFEVLVDYAHTPSSFTAIFPPLHRRISSAGGRIISLFGSAGERDTAKRSEQGRIAAQYSDIIILCDEDPRGEDPMSILEEIAAGVEEAGGFTREERLFLIPSRPQAIKKACSLARPGDLVLLLGKGHENSIIYKDRSMPYDEIAEAEAVLKALL